MTTEITIQLNVSRECWARASGLLRAVAVEGELGSGVLVAGFWILGRGGDQEDAKTEANLRT